jgi:hypothetical protein
VPFIPVAVVEDGGVSAGPLTTQTIGTVAATSKGTVITSGAINTKGSYGELTASAPFDADGFTLVISEIVGDNNMIDIAIGAAGAEVVIVENLPVEGNLFSGAFTTFIPIPIPAGSRVAARVQNQAASIALGVSMVLTRNSPLAHLGLTIATTYGVSIATTVGTTLAYSGSTNTKGAWAELSPSTTGRTRLLLVVVGLRGGLNAGTADALVDIGIGAAGSEVTIVGNLATSIRTNVDYWSPQAYLLPVDIPPGSRLAARQQMSSDQLLGAVAIGFS